MNEIIDSWTYTYTNREGVKVQTTLHYHIVLRDNIVKWVTNPSGALVTENSYMFELFSNKYNNKPNSVINQLIINKTT